MSTLMPNKEQIILGIDPGIADTGYGVIRCSGTELEYIACGSIQTSKKMAMPERLVVLEKELGGIIKKYKPYKASIEELFFCKNVTTALIVGQARGVILLVLAKNHLPVSEFTPLQVKQAMTGYGKADKSQIQQMVKLVLKLKAIPRPDDAADALAIAISAANRFQDLIK